MALCLLSQRAAIVLESRRIGAGVRSLGLKHRSEQSAFPRIIVNGCLNVGLDVLVRKGIVGCACVHAALRFISTRLLPTWRPFVKGVWVSSGERLVSSPM
jgi:hypothetical protein